LINGSIWPPNYQTSRSSKIETERARELVTLQYFSRPLKVQDLASKLEEPMMLFLEEKLAYVVA
jgi:hypothetical protein